MVDSREYYLPIVVGSDRGMSMGGESVIIWYIAASVLQSDVPIRLLIPPLCCASILRGVLRMGYCTFGGVLVRVLLLVLIFTLGGTLIVGTLEGALAVLG